MAPIEVAEMVSKVTDEEFTRHTLEIIGRELGAYGLARFIRLSGEGAGDYTQDRQRWQEEMTVQDVIASMDAHSCDCVVEEG